MTEPYRSSLQVTLAVWRALFLREALTRITGARARWFWVLAEPLAHMAFFVVLFGVFRQLRIPGIDALVWIVAGMSTFFIFRRSGIQGMWAIDDNRAMFVYRQVRPVDTVFIRAALDGFINLLIGLLAIGLLALADRSIAPEQPLLLMGGVAGAWLLGLGFALIAAVPVALVEETNVFLGFIMTPLYLLSGTIFPLVAIPYPYLDWLSYNPLAHALEAVRLGFSSSYHTFPGMDLGYAYVWALIMIFLGLALQVRFSERLVSQ